MDPFAVLVYFLTGAVVQLFFELAWQHKKLPQHPHIWKAAFVGVLLWPITLLPLLWWAISLVRKWI